MESHEPQQNQSLMALGVPTANPIRSAVQHIRSTQADLTPRQQAVRDAGRRQVDALVASGHFSLAPRF